MVGIPKLGLVVEPLLLVSPSIVWWRRILVDVSRLGLVVEPLGWCPQDEASWLAFPSLVWRWSLLVVISDLGQMDRDG